MRDPDWITGLEDLRDKAKPGEWIAEPSYKGADNADIMVKGYDPSCGDGYVFVDSEGIVGCGSLVDAEYVVALHNALPHLIALIRSRT